ncbi:MAG: hypothetical protein ACHREM_27655 [Polyangiales bacterium]
MTNHARAVRRVGSMATCGAIAMTIGASSASASDPCEGPPAISIEAGSLVRSDACPTAWKLPLHRIEGSPPIAPPPPVRVGDDVYVCANKALLRVRLSDGVVLARTPLPLTCTELHADGAAVSFTVGRNADGVSWSRTWKATDRIPFFVAGNGLLGYGRAQAILFREPESNASPEEWQKPGYRKAMEDALPELAALAARDPTNPWLDLRRGVYLSKLGRRDEALAAIDAALAHAPEFDFELLPMVREIDAIDPVRAQKAFDRGLAFLKSTGFEPRLAHAPLTLMTTLGRGGDDARPVLDVDADWDRLTRFADRVHALTPEVQGGAGLFAALANAAPRHADAAAAARYRSWAAAAATYGVTGTQGEAGDRTAQLVTIVAALAYVPLAWLVVRVLRAAGVAREQGTSLMQRWSLVPGFTRVDLAALMLAVAVLFGLGREASRGVEAIGVEATAPAELLSGNLGHPAALAYLEASRGRSGAEFIRAIALDQAGDRGAESAYRTIVDRVPEARLNLARLLARRGDVTAARAELDRTPPGDRLDGDDPASVPIATPTPAHWNDLWRTRAEARSELRDPLHATLALFGLTSTLVEASPGGAPWIVVDVAIFFAMLLAFALPRPDVVVRRSVLGDLGWALSLLFPGGARSFGPFGPLVTATIAWLGIGYATLRATHGATSSPLAALASVDMDRYFGVTAAVAPHGFAAACDGLAAAFPWILIGHYVFVAIVEVGAPDPLGPLARLRASRRPA